MMKGIKGALVFLFGAFYASLWWIACLTWDVPASAEGVRPWRLVLAVLGITTFVLLLVVCGWLSDNWDKE